MNANDIEAKDKAIQAEFAPLTSWEARYEKIIAKGKAMDALPDSEKNEDLKVRGCQSQVWIKADFKAGKVHFKADSDALIVRGLISLLLELYSGATPEEILKHNPMFIESMGLVSHLSPSRANGLHAMLKQIKFYAIAFKAQSTVM